jgi:Trypsin-co-occurring domain 1
MAKTMIVTLPSGKKVLFGAPPKGGLHEVSALDKAIETSSGTFQKALSSLGELVAVLEKSVGALEKRPSKVEMEFGATLSGDCDLGSSPAMARPSSKSRCPGTRTTKRPPRGRAKRIKRPATFPSQKQNPMLPSSDGSTLRTGRCGAFLSRNDLSICGTNEARTR